MKFYRALLHWNDDRLIYSGRDKSDIQKYLDILNTLTPEQVKAVEFYGNSRYEEGFDSGIEEG
jgi:hypothetical protein